MTSSLADERKRNRLAVLSAAAGLALVTIAVRLWPAWQLNIEVADVAVYRQMAEIVLRGDNIYAPRVFFPYVPYSQFIPAAALRLAQISGWPFDFTMKLPSVAADAGTTVLILAYLLGRGDELRSAAVWALAWALNPVSILISAFHGNLMSLIPFCVTAAVLAIELADSSRQRAPLLAISALMLGLGIALRSIPILFLPAFLVLRMRSLREAGAFIALAAFPAALSSLPYFLYARETFVRELFSYSGFTDFGWVSVARALPTIFRGHPLIGPLDAQLLDLSKSSFVLGYSICLLLLPLYRRRSLVQALLLPPLLFYGLYGGVSAQYLVWALPLFLLTREAKGFVYTAVATVALVSFYLLYHPAIVLGRTPSPFAGTELLVELYAAGNLLLVGLSLAWGGGLLIAELWPVGPSEMWAPVAWVRRHYSLVPLVAYGAASLLAIGYWLLVLAHAVARAQEVVGAMLR